MNFPLPLLACACLAAPVLAGENHFQLFDHARPAAGAGVSLVLENRDPADFLPLDSLRLVLSVGDGAEMRRVELDRRFDVGESVEARLVVDGAGARLFLDGLLAAETVGGYRASGRPTAAIAETVRWFKSPTRYRIKQGAYRLSVDGETVSGEAPRGVGGQLELFEFPLGALVEAPAQGGRELTFETRFAIEAVTTEHFTGAIDRYFQAAAGDWPDKITSDEQLRQAREKELLLTKDWKRPADWDRWGGLTTAGWREDATGFFRVARRDGKWWLISPEGHPLFFTGVCVVPSIIWTQTPTHQREHIFEALPPKTGPTAELWADCPWRTGEPDYISPIGWNLLRKFGPDWKELAIADCSRRLDAWAFSGIGKFSDREDVPPHPRVETIKIETLQPLVRHIDVFDAKARAEMRAHLEEAVRPWKNDPRIVGFSVGNEYGEIFTTAEIREVLDAHADSPVARAMRSAVGFDEAPTDAQLEEARQFYAMAYYDFIYRTMKELAPNHLYLSFWITPGWWQNEADWDMAARYCDVIGYDKYALEYGGNDGSVLKLIAKNDKPTMVGEFSFAPWFGGARGFRRYSTYVETQDDAAAGYERYVGAAAADPRCIGALWFQYRDVPVCGWGGEGDPTALVRGESYAQGLVDITDQPKWEFVERVRATNLRLTTDRLLE